MQKIKLNEATAARTRIPVALYDTSGVAVTNFSGGTPSGSEIQVSENGAAFANFAGTLTELSDGAYYYEPAAAELNTLGFLMLKFEEASIRTAFFTAQIVAYDPYAASGMATGAVLPDDSIVAASIASNAITAGKIASAAITAAKIDAAAITAAKFAADAITSTVIADNAITSNKLANAAITAAKIATDAIDDDALSADAVAAIVAGVFAHVFEDAETFQEFVRLARAALYGDVTGLDTDSPEFLGEDGVAVRISADLSGADRANTLDAT